MLPVLSVLPVLPEFSALQSLPAMKILFIITDMNIGGAQRLLADMLPRLASADDL